MTRRLERLSRKSLPRVVALEANAQPHPWTAGQLGEAFDDARACVWGAFEGDALLGYAVLYRLPFDAELQAISVAHAARRRGVARTLLTRLCEQADAWGSERLLLEVRDANLAAQALYAQAGFVVDGRRQRYYRSAGNDGSASDEDAVLMSKRMHAGRPPA